VTRVRSFEMGKGLASLGGTVDTLRLEILRLW